MCLFVADGLAIQPGEFAVAFRRLRLQVALGGDVRESRGPTRVGPGANLREGWRFVTALALGNCKVPATAVSSGASPGAQ